MKKFTKEDAMKGYKTREEINKAIEIVGKQNGLTVQKEKWACRDGVIGLDAENLNIFTEIDWDYNIHEDFVQYVFKVSFRASVSRMGANYTTEGSAKTPQKGRREMTYYKEYKDKNGETIHVGDYIQYENGRVKQVYEWENEYGLHGLGTDATNPSWIEDGRALPCEFGIYDLTYDELQEVELCGKN